MSLKTNSNDVSKTKQNKVSKPIVYGNTATKLQKQKYNLNGKPHTHKWTFYVKPYYKENLSVFIKKVEIKLDESFKNPTRVFHDPPYEVTETGWGEFDVFVKIYFKCPKAKPVSFYHRVNLFPSKDNLKIDSATVALETYDEMVFPEPSNFMRSLLESTKSLEMNTFHFDFIKMEKDLVDGLQKAQYKAAEEILDVREDIEKKQKQIELLQNALEEYHRQNSIFKVED